MKGSRATPRRLGRKLAQARASSKDGAANDKDPEAEDVPKIKHDSQPQLPALKWWTGLVIYAVTNVGFLKLFEYCSTCTELPVVLRTVAFYYAATLLLRLFMRRVVGLKPAFPQFWWEGMPTRNAAHA